MVEFPQEQKKTGWKLVPRWAGGATIAKPGRGEHRNNMFEQKNNMK
jgi:hypothetical protein